MVSVLLRFGVNQQPCTEVGSPSKVMDHLGTDDRVRNGSIYYKVNVVAEVARGRLSAEDSCLIAGGPRLK